MQRLTRFLCEVQPKASAGHSSHLQGLWLGPHKGDACLLALACKCGILAEEAVAWVDGVHAGIPGGLDDACKEGQGGRSQG